MSTLSIFWLIVLIAFVIYMVYHDKKIKGSEEYRSAISAQKRPPKKLLYKRWWAWLLIVALLIFSLGSNDEPDSSTSNETETSTPNHGHTASSSKKANDAKPVVEKNTAKAVTLGAGKYKIGRDIKPGRYVIRALKGSGNISNSDASINIILGTTADDDQITSFTTNLQKGDKLDISGIESTSFKPVTKYSFQKSLSAGNWLVGRDIKPGRYVIKPVTGSGNLISEGSEDEDLNEILSTSPSEGEVSKVTADLVKGEALQTNLELIKLIEK